MIGDDIEVSVLSVVGEKVRIGIQAPRAVPVYRREVYVQIQREQATAVTDAAPGTASEVDAPPS
jgi:carbon storage regulator